MADRSVAVELRLKSAQYLAGIHAAKQATRDLANETLKATKQNHQNLQQVGRAGLIAGGAIAAGLGLAAKSALEFDKSLSGVKAVANATSAEMKDLRQAALDAGQATVFSATESADAEAELAKAGVAVKDILGGGLLGSLNLAAAGQIGVADAANIAATAMVQFEKSGKDVPHIADLLAAAANKAQGGVSDMAQSLKYVGPVANQMGISLEETVGTIAELANAGIIGDQAGTSLRGMLTSLTSPSKIAATEMKTLGINLYDATGQFVGFNGVADQLHKTLGTLGQAERDQALGRIFGNEQITAARILYKGGAEDVDRWTKSVNDTGAAERIAATNMDNLAGDLEQLRGSIKTALIGQGEAGTSVLRHFAQGATGAVNAISGLPDPVQKTGFYMGALTSATLLTLGAVGTMVPKIREARTALVGLGAAGELANKGLGALGKAGAIGAGMVAFGFSVQFLSDKLTELEGKGAPAVDALTNSLVKFQATGKANNDIMKSIGEDGHQLSDDLDTLGQLGAGLGLTLNKTSFGTFGRGLDQARDRVDAIDKSLASLVSQGYEDQAAAIFKAITANLSPEEVKQLRLALNDYTGALDGADTQATLAADSTGKVAAAATDAQYAVDGLSPAVRDAAAALKVYKDALNDTAAIDAYTATAQLAQSFKDLKTELKGGEKASSEEIQAAELRLKSARDAASKGGATASERASVIDAEKRLAELRAKGKGDKIVTNEDKINIGDFASRVKAAGDAVLENSIKTKTLAEAQKDANAVLQGGHDQLVKLAREAGYGAKQAERLADRLIEIPPVEADVTTPGLDDAIDKLKEMRRIIRQLTANGVSLSVATGTANKLGARGFATGGLIPGPPSRSDTVPAMLSTGEFVVNAASTSVHRGLLEAINSGQRFADGGYVRGGNTYSTSSGRSITLSNTIVAPDPVSAGQSVSRQVQNDLWASGMLS
jgi:TP901 family phage tail tape measure protein